MSSTPLFDSIARRAARPADGWAVAAPAATPVAVPARIAPTARTAPTAPTSPFSAPVAATDSAPVPAALVAAIDAIPAAARTCAATAHPVHDDQLVLVEAVADAITRAVVDAVVAELERIARDGVVRA